MLEINPKLQPIPAVDQVPAANQVKAPDATISKKGTMVILSPSALKLSRELQAVQNDPDKDPSARLDASVQLRKMAAQILTTK